ncbi:uncharacterized protein LOC128714958 [Anopheles marshallii]|uniref:uncharacterized protein LOC128714958 n=1 Tax=Anopheles marshallii TaxID=1521116 RepID=UPI00237B6377|nr:uncharacterized protein LOC128714958 [Anopheles marshallii]
MSTTKRHTRAVAKTALTHPQSEANSSHNLPPVKPKLRNITNTIRMSTGEESPAKKKRKSDPNPPQECDQPSQPELVAFERLRYVLGRHYFDVCQRLALDYVPRCVRNIAECAQRHVCKRSPRTKCVSVMRQANTHDQIREFRPDQFIGFLNQAIMRQEFIDSELFVAGLQLMLTINRPSEELQVEYGTVDIVVGMGEVLEKCLKCFPPCRWDLRPAYQRIVFGQLDAACFEQCDQREGLLRNVLHLIEHNIETEREPANHPGLRKRMTKRSQMNEDDEMHAYNYNTWILTNRLCYDFNKLSREERFERLFAVLQILVKLLEMDFAMWILRNPTKTQQNLCNPSRSPLVAQLVWNGDHGSVNLFIKKLFHMFINMNVLQYPEDDIAVVSRLLNIVTVAVNLSEFQHNEGQIQYPCVKDNSLHYARQLWKALESSGYFSIPLCLSTIRSLRSPFLQLHLAEHLLQKFNRSLNLRNVRSFFQLLLNRGWLDCATDEPSDGSDHSASIYPVFNTHRTRLKTCEIYQQQYVDLLLIGLRAYCDMHQLPAYFREIMVQPAPETSSTIDATVREDLPNSNVCPPGARIVPPIVPDERMIFQGVAMSGELLLEYRDDIKYLLLIEQQLKKIASTEEKALFHQWIIFLSEVDPSLTII